MLYDLSVSESIQRDSIRRRAGEVLDNQATLGSTIYAITDLSEFGAKPGFNLFVEEWRRNEFSQIIKVSRYNTTLPYFLYERPEVCGQIACHGEARLIADEVYAQMLERRKPPNVDEILVSREQLVKDALTVRPERHMSSIPITDPETLAEITDPVEPVGYEESAELTKAPSTGLIKELGAVVIAA